MSRTKILIYGVICWTVAGVDALVHLLAGDVLVPAAMGVTFVVWMALRGHLLMRRNVEAEASSA